jgi:hypothetical protein
MLHNVLTAGPPERNGKSCLAHVPFDTFTNVPVTKPNPVTKLGIRLNYDNVQNPAP